MKSTKAGRKSKRTDENWSKLMIQKLKMSRGKKGRVIRSTKGMD